MTVTPYIRQLQAIPHTQAGPAKDILDIALKQVGFIPNMYANMANAPAVLSTYLHGYSLFRSESGLRPAEQEVVFLAISRTNDCDYCLAAHSMLADKKSGVPLEVLSAIRAGEPVPDARLAALYDLAVNMVRRQGNPDPGVLQSFFEAGYQERDVLYVILAIAVKTLSNYANHAFGTPVDAVFETYRVN